MGRPDPVFTLRNAPLDALVRVLQEHHDAKLDVVVPSGRIRSHRGHLRLAGAGAPHISSDGVTQETVLRPTVTAENDVAEKLGIPVPYLRRMRAEQIGLYDATVNAWLDHDPDRRFLLRTILSRPGEGIVRAVLSDTHSLVDHLDVLAGVLRGIEDSGVRMQVSQCDLSEQRMYIKIVCPEISLDAPPLLRGYHSPRTMTQGAHDPLVFAGLVLSHSETDHGTFSLTPQLTMRAGSNGVTIVKDAICEPHLASRMPAGAVAWSSTTHRAVADLVASHAHAAAHAFLNRGYVQETIRSLLADSGLPISDPEPVVDHVCRALRLRADQRTRILEHFLTAGAYTSGGVMHAVTSAAQAMPDPDDGHAMERVGVRALHLAAHYVRQHQPDHTS
jgi:hypothetical protein